jgi:type III secretory pathway component EscU
MKKLVIRSLEAVTAVAFFLIVAWCTLAGFYALKAAGLPAIGGALVGLVVGSIIAVIPTGVIYLLISINDNLSRIKQSSESTI